MTYNGGLWSYQFKVQAKFVFQPKGISEGIFVPKQRKQQVKGKIKGKVVPVL
jgi:hypothetical protein